jgi:O-antigen/teichoic acid export membrane protein
MSTIQKIAKNTFLLISSNIISLALGFVLNIYIARYLGPDHFGIISAALNLAMLFTYAADLGISSFLTMHLSRNHEDYQVYINNSLAMRLLLIGGSYASLLVLAILFNFSGTKMLVVGIIGLYVMLTAVSQIFQAMFQAFQSMEHLAICQFLNPVILLLGMLFVITNNLGVVAFALVYLVSGVVILTYNIIIATVSYKKPRLEFKINVWKSLIIGGLPFSMSAILNFLNFRIDIQLIDVMLGDTSVGYYSAAFKFIEAIMCIPSLYISAIFPVISLYFFSRNSNLHLLLEKSIKYLLILGIPISIGLFLCSDKIIFLFYQDKYIPSVGVLQGLSLGLLFIFLNATAGAVLLATNLQKASVIMCVIGAMFNISLNLLVIPVYGITGSAYTMALTQGILFLMVFYLYSRAGYRMPKSGEMLKIVGCAVIMGIFVYFAHSYSLLLIIGLSILLYSALILLTRSISPEDISLISSIFLKKKR